MANPKFADVRPGDVLVADDGFTCIRDGARCTIHFDKQIAENSACDHAGFFVDCADGQHFLDGQEAEDGTLIGFVLLEKAPA
ncbi:MAG TPA: hypothetical protein VHW02_07725 [Rhizomicrobium sp.]|jgi:hypothetical protein|nr:hypothetical protein [Rhizomicrobium sp.]